VQYVALSCFEGFECLAGACPDTCCAGWEVDLDTDTQKRYQEFPGPLGEKLRSLIRQEDGYTFFAMEQGKCPFLREDRLCDLILRGGEQLLSVTCREHPRFWEEYGDLQETCLAISCPEAARRLLEGPAELQVRETEEPGEEDWELDEALLDRLLALRKTLFALARSSQPLEERFLLIEAQAEAFQAGLDGAPVRSDRGRSFGGMGFLRAMSHMEFTDKRLPALLERVPEDYFPSKRYTVFYGSYAAQAENLLIYFLYRYVLRAVWDGQVLEKVRFCTSAVEAIFALGAGMPGDFRENLTEAAIRFGREVEHSDENLRLLYDWVCTES
jgi:lysine-N-methylase